MSKTLTLLGFASKAGKLSYGFDATVDSLKTKKSFLVLIANNISDKSKKEVAYFSTKNDVEFFVLNDYDITTISESVGRKCGIISLNDRGFAEAVTKALAENKED